MKRKKHSIIVYVFLIALLLLGVGGVMYRGTQTSKKKPFKARIHGTWNKVDPDFDLISFDTLYSDLPSDQFKYFYYAVDSDSKESEHKLKTLSGEGEGHLDEGLEEIFLDSGILAGESLKLDAKGQLVIVSTRETFSKTGDNYSTISFR